MGSASASAAIASAAADRDTFDEREPGLTYPAEGLVGSTITSRMT